MHCTFDKEGNLLKFEVGEIWFNASHYHEDKGKGSRDFPMGSLQSSVAEYEHRTGNRGTLAKIEAERAKWMESPERMAMLVAAIPVVPAPSADVVEAVAAMPAEQDAARVSGVILPKKAPVKPKPTNKPKAKGKSA